MKKLLIVLCLIPLLLLSSCATTSPSEKEEDAIKSALIKDDTAAALTALASVKESYNDESVYNLDYGMLAFYNGDYENAIDALTAAETVIENNRITSISEGAAGLIANDNVKAYSGANYEDLYIKGVKALSYYALGDLEGAMVEIRRANVIARDFALNPEAQSSWIEELVLALTPNPYQYFSIPEVSDYTESSFSRYLSLLMYAALKDEGNASIDYDALVESGSVAVSEEDFIYPQGKARVNFIAFNGLIADKEAASAMAQTGAIRHLVSWPYIPEYEGSSVFSVDITCSNGETTTLSTLEDVSDAARANVAMDAASKYLGSYYRGMTKMTATKVTADTAYDEAIKLAVQARDEAKKAVQGQNDFVRGLAEAAADKAYDVAVEAAEAAREAALAAVNETEIPDIRMARFLPDTVCVGGLTLDPGVYDFTMTFHTASGDVVKTFNGVEVSDRNLNVVFASCAR